MNLERQEDIKSVIKGNIKTNRKKFGFYSNTQESLPSSEVYPNVEVILMPSHVISIPPMKTEMHNSGVGIVDDKAKLYYFN